jgi:hypothetical protein
VVPDQVDVPQGRLGRRPLQAAQGEAKVKTYRSVDAVEVGREWEQAHDDCAPNEDHQRLRLELVDAGAGHYPVLSTARWAFEDGAYLRKLADIVDAMLAQRGISK